MKLPNLCFALILFPSGLFTPLLGQQETETRNIEFLGWNYAELGYALSPGESPSLRFCNHGTDTERLPFEWQLTTYLGDPISSGKTTLELPPEEIAETPISGFEQLTDGPYFIHYTLGNRKNRFYFDFRRPRVDASLNLNLLAMIDNMDGEAWTGMLFGPLEPFVNVFSDWPVDDTAVDAVILISETIQADDFRFAKLKSYLNEGGNLLVFGKPADALSVILPVEVAEKKPWIENPQYIQTGTAGPWSGFEVNNGPSHYGIKLKANAGSEILANWEDGTPAVVLGKYGRGTVVYVGSGSGQVWQKRPELEGADEMALRLVYWMAKGKFSIDAALKQAEDIYRQNRAEDIALRDWVLEESDEEKPEHFAVISKRNAGRFGWQIEEGGLVDNLRSNGQVSPPMTRHFQFRGSRDEVDREAAFRLKPGSVSEEPEVGEVKQSWFSKTISWNFENGESIQSTLSLGSPAILWEGSSNTIDLDVSGITHLAYVTGQGVQIQSVDKPIPASELAEGWLLLFRARGDVRDMPLLVVLTRGPQEIKYDGGLLVSFNEGGFASLFTMRLFGIRRFASGETMAWEKGIPSEAIQAARLWNQRLLQFQVDCVEIAWRENNAIQIANRFRYQEIKSDWPVHPATLAPLPPVLSLALEAGAPVQLPGNTQDLNCATKYGPLQAVEGDFTKITIPIPPQDHRAIIPVKGRMELQDKIDRLTSGLALGTKNYNDNIRGPGEGDLQADLHPYDISKALPYNEAPNIDTYKFWLTFNSLLARPVYSPAIREAVDRHNWERYRETLNFYSHKCFVMRKREPLSGVEYLITFVWPTNTYSGFRSFHDANEASGVNAYCFTNYARYYGDWTTLEANWNHCRRLWEFLPRVNDWACMASGALEYWQVAGLDMLNSEPYGNFAYAYAARQAGYPGEELLAQTLGAKSMVAAVSRFALESYLASITGAGDPWREFLGHFWFSEYGIQATSDLRTSLTTVGMSDSAKGTFHEFSLAYKEWVGERMNVFQSERAQAGSHSPPDLTQRLILGWDQAELLEQAKAYEPRDPKSFGAAKDLYDLALACVGDIPLFLSEWAPAEYVSGEYDPDQQTVTLVFRSSGNASFPVRIYSQREPIGIRINGSGLQEGDLWFYDRKTGWLEVQFESQNQESNLQISLGAPAAPLHPYFTRVSQEGN